MIKQNNENNIITDINNTTKMTPKEYLQSLKIDSKED
jgi:hypothetical protein